MKRTAKKGNSTPKTKKTRPTPRFYEVKIHITAEDFFRGQPYFQDKKYLSRFVLDAFMEKVNRAEANNKAARLKMLISNGEILAPVLREMFQQGKLDFLKGGENGETRET